MKKLVVYYSFGGNTRAVAKKIARALDADIAEIRTTKTYPDDYDVLLGIAKREVETDCIPPIYALPADAQAYDTIILGTPVWWYSYAPAVKTFMKGIKWGGKKVYPFATHHGKLGHTPSDLRKALRGAAVAPVFSVVFQEKQQVTPEHELNAWISSIQ